MPTPLELKSGGMGQEYFSLHMAIFGASAGIGRRRNFRGAAGFERA